MCEDMDLPVLQILPGEIFAIIPKECNDSRLASGAIDLLTLQVEVGVPLVSGEFVIEETES